MLKIYEFKETIKAHEGLDGAYVEFPYNVKEEFGTNGIVKVIATFDGVEYRGALVKMSTLCHIIGITKAIRKKIGKQPGDEITVTIKRDIENKVNDMPESFAIALKENKQVTGFFDNLTASQKNKFINFIASAKKKETADARVAKVITMLENKEKMK
ncbi:YdeI/OmpD-associated family protein [Tissierella sp. MSJ-40]|uniref:YdeI/OmpD-associated family protein n=1 Tax=Tissierella simiarum TaxID=2841534 RepID=A0ABS6E7N0_9FIRM|nr:YdeI/OmpD-associated family protein [Tissierella simiarum]MBU5438851.1 YdeI/OmpD-associated family protein [Tissierella simiarum]